MPPAIEDTHRSIDEVPRAGSIAAGSARPARLSVQDSLPSPPPRSSAATPVGCSEFLPQRVAAHHMPPNGRALQPRPHGTQPDGPLRMCPCPDAPFAAPFSSSPSRSSF
jgi:hypothetical protein